MYLDWMEGVRTLGEFLKFMLLKYGEKIKYMFA